MKIYCLDPKGISKHERDANKMFEEHLPANWKGYSSLEMIGRQGKEFEGDVILVTHDRIIVVELKDYKGRLFSKGQRWVVQFGDHEEVRTNGVRQARRSAQILSSKIKHRLKHKLFTPWVDYCVVLCSNADKSGLHPDERDFVFSLKEFCEIADRNVYDKLFDKLHFPIKRKEDQPNKNKGTWDRFFSLDSPDFKAKSFSVNSYVLKGDALFRHRDKLYEEYLSERKDDSNYRALMRRWDFTASIIADKARTPEERQLVACRESRALGYIDSQDEDLKSIHLGLVYLPSDVTADFVELYEWPNTKMRLLDFMAKKKVRLDKTARLDLIQALLSQIARLHNIDVAHRDIGDHSVWLSLPSKVVLSNFLTASFPDLQNKTVSSFRDALKHGRVEIPEDYYDDPEGTSFTRDVYLAASVAHYIAFDIWPPKGDEGVYCWAKIPGNELSDLLTNWFETALDLSASSRFPNMERALESFNLCIGEEDTVRTSTLSMLDPYIMDTNIYMVYQPEQIGSPKGTTFLYRSGDGQFGIKVWNGVSDVNPGGGANHQLISFLGRAQSYANSIAQFIPSLREFGYNPSMQCLFIVYDWVDGDTWRDWESRSAKEDVLKQLKKLLEAILSVHRNHLIHGDVHPENIVATGNDVKFIDLLDYDAESSTHYNSGYLPKNYRALSAASKDRFAIVKILHESASRFDYIHLEEYCRNLLDQVEIPEGDLNKLNDEFFEIVSPPPPKPIKVYDICGNNHGADLHDIASDNGRYYINVKLNSGREKDLVRITISGTNEQFSMLIKPGINSIVNVSQLEQIRHDRFMSNKRYAPIDVEAKIYFKNGPYSVSPDLIEYIFESDHVKNILDRDKKKVIKPKREINKPKRNILTLKTSEKPKIESIRRLWKALVDTEFQTFPKIIVTQEPKSISSNKRILHYTTENQSLDFNLNTEKVWLKMEIGDQQRVIGIVAEISRDSLIYFPRSKLVLGVGDTLYLEGGGTATSLARREKAVDGLIAGRCVQPKLVDYFDPNLSMLPVEVSGVPTEEELEDYTEYDDSGKIVFSLNEQQREAFKKLYSYGPLSLLQGPPGTGKTAFIGCYIHHSIEKGAKRILLVSQSHEAVNNAAEKVRNLYSRKDKKIDIVRLGDQQNVSEALEDVGEIALQDHYREKFRAEYKQRVMAAASHLAIENVFVEMAVEYELSYGQKFDSLASMYKDKDLIDDVSLHSREKSIRAKFGEFCKREYGINFETTELEISDIRSEFLEKLALLHDVHSPALMKSFSDILYIANEWLSVMSSRKAQFQNFLAKTRVLVCGTCVGVARPHYGINENIYDLVVIDEAARSNASELAIAMQVGKKVLLVGDHKQLPPHFEEEHLLAAQRRLQDIPLSELERSDFERAFLSDYGKEIGQSLVKQYRMARPICELVSSCFYEPELILETGRDDVDEKIRSLRPELGATVTWVDTSSLGESALEQRGTWKGANAKSYINDAEANEILRLIREISESESLGASVDTENEPLIGVICMYADQRKHLVRKVGEIPWARSLLEKRVLKIDTVDSYQGKENTIVIVSLVRSNRRFDQGYVASENRANVALSRAKERLYIVGNRSMWAERNTDSPFGKVVAHMSHNENSEYVVINAVAGG